MVAPSKDMTVAVGFFATGAVLGLAGGLLGLTHGIMSNVE